MHEQVAVSALVIQILDLGADTAGRMLEIGVATSDGIDSIVHAMPARAKFLEP